MNLHNLLFEKTIFKYIYKAIFSIGVSESNKVDIGHTIHLLLLQLLTKFDWPGVTSHNIII